MKKPEPICIRCGTKMSSYEDNIFNLSFHCHVCKTKTSSSNTYEGKRSMTILHYDVSQSIVNGFDYHLKYANVYYEYKEREFWIKSKFKENWSGPPMTFFFYQYKPIIFLANGRCDSNFNLITTLTPPLLYEQMECTQNRIQTIIIFSYYDD